jgi:DNA polymerase II large subunit
MAEAQLSVRSTRAKTLAHKLARKERRTIAQVVEKALEQYDRTQAAPKKESVSDFWDRMTRDFATDVDLDAILQEHRRPYKAIKL